MRDVRQVVAKLKVVLIPLGRDSPQSVLQKLRECKSICITIYLNIDLSSLLIV